MKMWLMIAASLAVGFAPSFGTGIRIAYAQSDNGYVMIVPPPLTGNGRNANPSLQPQDMYPPPPEHELSESCLKWWFTVSWEEQAQQYVDAGRPMSGVIASAQRLPCRITDTSNMCHDTPEDTPADEAEAQQAVRIIKEIYAGKHIDKHILIPKACR